MKHFDDYYNQIAEAEIAERTDEITRVIAHSMCDIIDEWVENAEDMTSELIELYDAVYTFRRSIVDAKLCHPMVFDPTYSISHVNAEIAKDPFWLIKHETEYSDYCHEQEDYRRACTALARNLMDKISDILQLN